MGGFGEVHVVTPRDIETRKFNMLCVICETQRNPMKRQYSSLGDWGSWVQIPPLRPIKSET